MKKKLLFAFSICCLIRPVLAQTYLPIPTTGYNLDAIAENTTAISTTGGVIDGSNNVMYSAAYGVIFGGGTTYGVPNNGLIVNGTRSYQLQSYTQNNVLYLPALQADTLLVTTPSPFPSVSLLAFCTEGPGTMTVKLRFTDGTSQTFSSIGLDDWFNTVPTNVVLTGIDRASRPLGTPNYNGLNPRFFRIDLNLSCTNRLKNLQKIIVQNTLNGTPRVCVMAVSGGVSATYTVNTSPVTCLGGTNGSATLSISNGVPPFTFAWATNPVQNTAAVNLSAGVTNYTVTDASSCTYTSSVTVTTSLVPPVPLVISSSQNPVCSGSTVTLTTSGASTYTWSNNGSSNTTTSTISSNTPFSVMATTSDNCTLNGSITVSVAPLPVITFTNVPAKLCLNGSGVSLSATPAGGTFGGTGISFGTFFPSLAGVGTQTISYSYTDQNNCMSVNIVTTTISTPTTVIAFAVTPSTFCTTSSSITLNATPAGGIYAGQGISGAALSPSLVGIGTFTVSYTFTDDNNCVASKVSSYAVKACSFVGIKELMRNVTYQLYPNPNNGSFNLTADADMQVSIVNDLGQTIQNIKLDSANERKITIENLPAGIYFLNSPDRLMKQKIVVTR